MTPGKVVIQVLLFDDRIEDLDRLFDSLARTDYPRELVEILAVQNSKPGREDIADAALQKWVPRAATGNGPRVRFMRNAENLGFAGGHQAALAVALQSDPEFLYLLNSDCSVEPGFIRAAVAYAAAHPSAALVQSRIMLEQEPELLNSSGNALHFLGFGFARGYRRRPAEPETLPMFYPSGAGVLVRLAALPAMGGLFDPEYFLYHEDSDLGWRALLTGHEVAYAPDSVVYHRYEFGRSTAKFYWIERNRIANLLIFFRLRTLALILPVGLAMEAGMLLFAFKNGWWREKLRALAWYFRPSTWRWLAARRSTVQALRVKRDRDLLERMVGEIANQEVESPLLTRVVNPVTRAYLAMLKRVVRW